MNIDLSMLEWARAQFAMTALFHFFFVPFTLGMSFMVAFFETIYVKTGKKEWKEITQFWQVLFGINFAIGLSTGIIHEFEFGTNWSTYSWVVGDLFGAPLAIEGVVAFFMEATFAAIAFFGWKRVSKGVHLTSSWLLAAGSNLSALWILIANGFMQHPTSAFYTFNIDTARLELTDFFALILQPVAQVKFLHVVTAAYTMAGVFVLGVSSLYLLRGKHTEFAKKSATVAAAFGLVASIAVAVIGDDHAYEVANTQPTKIASMEGLIVGERGAPIVAIGIPKYVSVEEMKNKENNEGTFLFEIPLPYMLSLLGKRDPNAFVPGLKDLVYGNDEYGIWSFEKLREEGKGIVICGDVNTAHKEIDLKNPKANSKISGFLPIEREWMDKLVDYGYVDSFRYVNGDEKDRYSWWSYRSNARLNNVGWRIDYFFISEDLAENLEDAFILDFITGSDHCPVGIRVSI